MGRFFNGQARGDKTKLIKYGTIAGGVLLIFIIVILIVVNNRGGKAVLTLKKSIDVEVNTKMPDKMEFFEKFENFDEDKITMDDSDVDLTTIGTYYVNISADGQGDADIEVNVVDTTAPTLTVKNVAIASGEDYNVEDFVASCNDNYDSECTIEYYNDSKDENGNNIAYGAYTEDGTYPIMIVAKDESGNASSPQNASLVIGNGGNGGSTATGNCKYGDLTVADNINYPVAVIVGDKTNNCALSMDSWANTNTQKPADDFYSADYEKLKSELQSTIEKEFPNGAKTVVYPHYIAVLNKDLTGLVGYAIYVRVYIADATVASNIDTTNNLKAAYYLNSDGTRRYDVNTYNLK